MSTTATPGFFANSRATRLFPLAIPPVSPMTSTVLRSNQEERFPAAIQFSGRDYIK